MRALLLFAVATAVGDVGGGLAAAAAGIAACSGWGGGGCSETPMLWATLASAASKSASVYRVSSKTFLRWAKLAAFKSASVHRVCGDGGG